MEWPGELPSCSYVLSISIIQNVLALTGEDRKVTFSDQDGNSIGQREIKFEVHSLKFSPDGAMVN